MEIVHVDFVLDGMPVQPSVGAQGEAPATPFVAGVGGGSRVSRTDRPAWGAGRSDGWKFELACGGCCSPNPSEGYACVERAMSERCHLIVISAKCLARCLVAENRRLFKRKSDGEGRSCVLESLRN